MKVIKFNTKFDVYVFTTQVHVYIYCIVTRPKVQQEVTKSRVFSYNLFTDQSILLGQYKAQTYTKMTQLRTTVGKEEKDVQTLSKPVVFRVQNKGNNAIHPNVLAGVH